MDMSKQEIKRAMAAHRRRLNQLRKIYTEDHPLIRLHESHVTRLEAKMKGVK